MGTYLARWGFTAQKPLRRAYEQDPAAVRRWLRRDYPARLLLGSGVVAHHTTKAATRAPSRALPRRRALCTNSKKAR